MPAKGMLSDIKTIPPPSVKTTYPQFEDTFSLSIGLTRLTTF